MATVADLLSRTRALLQDTSAFGYRYSDADLLAALNQALQTAFRIRPDLFYPSFSVPALKLSDTFPLEPGYEEPVVVYVAGFTELRDDQFTADGRAVALLNRFTAQLTRAAA